MADYMTRAMQASDPRYARILDKLGYGRRDIVAARPPNVDDDQLAAKRAEYQRVVGKKPFHGWDVSELGKRIDEAKSNGSADDADDLAA